MVCEETSTGTIESFNEYVIDGTFCDKDLNYGVCVSGKCMKTGCDHRLHSNLTFGKLKIAAVSALNCEGILAYLSE